MSSLYSASVSSREYGFNLADSRTAYSISNMSVSGKPKVANLSSPNMLAIKFVTCTYIEQRQFGDIRNRMHKLHNSRNVLIQ